MGKKARFYVTELEFPRDGRRVATLKTTDKKFCEMLSESLDDTFSEKGMELEFGDHDE
jgi:hypothetical protein